MERLCSRTIRPAATILPLAPNRSFLTHRAAATRLPVLLRSPPTILYTLKPVTFCYKKEIDPERRSQFGLVAEDVEKVAPDLVVHDKDGELLSVRYEQINTMLLNEFLKEHKAFLEQQRKVQKLEAVLDVVNRRLKEQEAKVEKVLTQVETSRPWLQVVQVP
jgi:hypothetical protein